MGITFHFVRYAWCWLVEELSETGGLRNVILTTGVCCLGAERAQFVVGKHELAKKVYNISTIAFSLVALWIRTYFARSEKGIQMKRILSLNYHLSTRLVPPSEYACPYQALLRILKFISSITLFALKLLKVNISDKNLRRSLWKRKKRRQRLSHLYIPDTWQSSRLVPILFLWVTVYLFEKCSPTLSKYGNTSFKFKSCHNLRSDLVKNGWGERLQCCYTGPIVYVHFYGVPDDWYDRGMFNMFWKLSL